MRQHRDHLFAEGIGATPAIAAMPPPDRTPGFYSDGPRLACRKTKSPEKRKARRMAGLRRIANF
jgi:hypothetical protein